tara:strand:+ start:77 stop:292 length:216 start_codon:yes stop_codon:yes gene_type:complete
MEDNSFEYSVRSTTRHCFHCGGAIEEGECNLRNGDEVDVYWFCPHCDWDERDDLHSDDGLEDLIEESKKGE